MSLPPWGEILARVEQERQASVIEREKARVRVTAEVFTPSSLVVEILMNTPLRNLEEGRRVLDPACGDGQFLSAVKWLKVLYFGMRQEAANEELFGIDIMIDNVRLCRARLGGGTIVVGDSLNPSRLVPGQTRADRATLSRILNQDLSEQDNLFLDDGGNSRELAPTQSTTVMFAD